MKCKRCTTVNTDTDTICACCKMPLIIPKVVRTPQWAFFFAFLCGILPVLTLGGIVPVMVGVGAAGSCMTVARNGSIPSGLRLIICLCITLGAWAIVAVMLLAAIERFRKRH